MSKCVLLKKTVLQKNEPTFPYSHALETIILIANGLVAKKPDGDQGREGWGGLSGIPLFSQPLHCLV